MLYLLYIVGFFLAKVLPLRVSYSIAEAASRVFCLFAGKDKEGLRANLKVILGENIPEKEITRHILSVFRNFAKYLTDFFRFQVFTPEILSRYVKLEGIEHVDRCLSEGKGVIILTLHLGNWELGGAIVGSLKYPISGIVLEHADRRINDFFVKRRALNRLKSIPIGTQLRECFRALKRNEMLAIVGDKDYTESGTYIDFFGKKALMPKGPAVISLKTGAPIVFCAVIREKDDTFRMCFEPPVRYAPTGDLDRDVRALMGKYIKNFEKYIRENPDQWYAFRRIWDREPITQ
ncbi:MAG: lysophospholipid acyltransferase family protein [Candidatus Omnitrophota bacterium]